MKVFLASVCAAILLAGAASLVLTQVLQVNAKTAFSASTAKP